MNQWDEYFMGIAKAVANKSHCLSHKYGAIAVDSEHTIVATGYNGPPRGYPHCLGYDELIPVKGEYRVSTNLKCPRWVAGYNSGEGLEYCPAAHAERNVLINAARTGHALKGCDLYITSPTPCRECAKEIVNAGISRVFHCSDITYPETGITGMEILHKCHVQLIRL